MAQNNSQTLKDLAATHQATEGVIIIDQQITDPAIAAQLADANALTATQSLIAQIGAMMDAKMHDQNIKRRQEIEEAVEIALKKQIEAAEKEDEGMETDEDGISEEQLLNPRDENAQNIQEDSSASKKSMDVSAKSKIRVDLSATSSNADASAASRNADTELQKLFGTEPEDGEVVSNDPELDNENQAFLAELLNAMSAAEDKGEPINSKYVDIIKGHFMAKSSLSDEITKSMQASHIPSNCEFLRVPKLNPELQASSRFANDQEFVLSNEKSLYKSSNIIHHLIGSLCKIVDASMNAISQEGGQSKPLDPKQIVLDALNGITLAGAVAAELAQKRRNNVRKICANDFQSLCGPKPGSLEAKKKPANKGEEFLLGDNLKEASKEAKRGADICKTYYEKPKGGYINKTQGFRHGHQRNHKPKAQFHKKQQYQDKPYSRTYNQAGQSSSSYRNQNDHQNRQHQNQSNHSK